MEYKAGTDKNQMSFVSPIKRINTPILAMDTDLAVWAREREVWRRHGIDVQRVDSMRDALEKLCRGAFLFTSI